VDGGALRKLAGVAIEDDVHDAIVPNCGRRAYPCRPAAGAAEAAVRGFQRPGAISCGDAA
jgi:hypothetical protein